MTPRRWISRAIGGCGAPAGAATIAAPGSWRPAAWPCYPRARRWGWPARRSGRGRPRGWRDRPGSRRCGPTRLRPSAGRRRAPCSSRSPTAAPISSEHLESVRDTGWDAVVRAAQDRRLATGGGSLTALRATLAMGAATVRTKQGAVSVCVAWRELELLPPRHAPAGRAPIRVPRVRLWHDTLEWLLLTSRPVETLDQALQIISGYSRRWVVEEFHKAWKTGCRAEQRQLEEADRLVPLLGALAIVAVRLLGLRDAARRHGAAPAAVPETTIQILAAKLQQPAEGFTTNRDFLRGVARLGGFLARRWDGEPGWQTIWKGWFVLSILVEGFELAQAIASVLGKGQCCKSRVDHRRSPSSTSRFAPST